MRVYVLLVLATLLFTNCSKDDSSNNNGLPSEFADFATVFDGVGIGGIIALSDEILILISLQSDRYAWYQNSKVQREWDFNDADGPFRSIGVPTVETGIILQRSKPNDLFLIYDFGNRYMKCTINGDLYAQANWDNPDFYFSDYRSQRDVVENWGEDGTFKLQDIGASISNHYMGCLNGIEVILDQHLLLDQDGTSLVNYKVDGLVNGPIFDISNITNYPASGCPPTNNVVPFESIGAAVLYKRPDGQHSTLYFSLDGKSFVYFIEGEDAFSEVYSF